MTIWVNPDFPWRLAEPVWWHPDHDNWHRWWQYMNNAYVADAGGYRMVWWRP